MSFAQSFPDVFGKYGEGAVHVTYSGQPKQILLDLGMEDAARGYSAKMPITYKATAPSKLRTRTLGSVGIMTGVPDPMMKFPANVTFIPYGIIQNTGNRELDLIPAISYMAGSSPVYMTLPKFHLSARETRRLDMYAMLQNTGLQRLNGEFNFTFTGDFYSGELLTDIGSIDPSGSYVFQVGAKAIQENIGKVLCNWQVGKNLDTMITLWNFGDASEDTKVVFFFAAGKYTLPVHLEPKASAMLSLVDIIKAQRPDVDGNTIPPGITEGSAYLQDAEAETNVIHIAMDTGIYNPKSATCGDPCDNCAGFNDLFVSAVPFNVGSTLTYQVTAIGQMHGGAQYTYTSSSDWATDNSSVAIVDNVYSRGLTTGVAGGNFYVNATKSLPPSRQLCEDNGWDDCYYSDMTGTGQGTVYNPTPVISSISPSLWFSGTTTRVTISGQYFGTNAPSLSISPSAGISYSLVSYNDTQIVADITVSIDTTDESTSITVTNNGYSGLSFQSAGGVSSPTSNSKPVAVNVPIPTNFRLDSYQTRANGELYLVHKWDSTSGSGGLANLIVCNFQEWVQSDGAPYPFYWPSPFPARVDDPNPYYGVLIAGTTGVLEDHLWLVAPPDTPVFRPPYATTTISHTQHLRWRCSNYQSNAWQEVQVNTITRKIEPNSSSGWKYSVKRNNDLTAIIDPLR